MSHQIHGMQNEVSEWGYTTGRRYADPFNDVELDVVVSHSEGESWRVPAYWAGGQEWRVRFRPPRPGAYEVVTVSSEASDGDLHERRSSLEASANDGAHPLLARGPLEVAASKRTFQHADGTPFFWLGDTWWMGLCKRWSWPDDFQLMTADRVAKGFTVIQIVAGLYPDMPALDERGTNEAGVPWEQDYSRINPAYFDMADLRIQWLVRSGLVPCIVGCWGYYLPILGVAKMKQHWRNLVARWGAYPVVWCLAGEGAMPYYLSEDKEGDKAAQIAGWTEVGRYVRRIDPCGHPVTIHPTQVGRDQVTDDTILDFDMLQTGHGGHESVPNTVRTILAERLREPVMPVLVGEVSYEGIMHGTQAEVQRLTFWASVLSGAAGHTYGANGIWQVNTRRRPFGPSPHGANWGTTPWEEAHRLAGSVQLGLARRLLERYEWWRFEPHQDWVSPAGSPEDTGAAFAAGIPGEVRVVYFYNPRAPWSADPLKVVRLEGHQQYRAFFWDPRDGREHDLGTVEPDADGAWGIPMQPTLQDWVVVLERQGS
ncbi:MAG TPA: DUF4038 domain-containing protein [Phycisphaerae bacterium]|nr:DUF4038 domain-containing protein [Phycisphaerae bacterium]